jgi:hypothetical protein
VSQFPLLFATDGFAAISNGLILALTYCYYAAGAIATKGTEGVEEEEEERAGSRIMVARTSC